MKISFKWVFVSIATFYTIYQISLYFISKKLWAPSKLYFWNKIFNFLENRSFGKAAENSDKNIENNDQKNRSNDEYSPDNQNENDFKSRDGLYVHHPGSKLVQKNLFISD